MVANANVAQQQYLKTRIETASQPQLLVMLFDAAVKKLHIAKKAIVEKDIEKSHTELTKVQKIFTELMVALDYEKGGDLANELFRIYDFVYHHLVKANIKRDTQLIDDVLPIVENLRDGWTKAVDKFMSDNGDKKEQPLQPVKPSINAVSTGTAPIPAKPAVSPPTPLRPAIAGSYKPAAPSGDSSSEAQRPRLNIRG